MDITSPITNTINIQCNFTIDKNIIINSYNKDLAIDVTRFFSGIDNIQVCECNETGYLFYYPLSISGDESFYDELKKKLPEKYNTPYYSAWKWEYDICIKYINKSDKVYEIGCGEGNFLLKLKESGVEEVYGTELNQDSVKAAVSKGLGVEYITIQEKSKSSKEVFDVVCSFQVLEHIADVKSFLDASIKILKKGGRLMIAVPFNDPYIFKNDKFNTLNMPPHHMGLWNRKAFENLCKFFPLRLEEIIVERLPNSGYDFDQYFSINKDIKYPLLLPFKSCYDKLYFKWLKKNHKKINGKNIIAIFKKDAG